jgi:hypothetical protein
MLRLIPRWRYVLLTGYSLFAGSWVVVNPVRTAVVSNVIGIEHSFLLNNGPVDIGVVDDGDVYLGDGGVIGKHAASPFAAGKTDSSKSESVIDAAVVADFISPVAVVEAVDSVCPSPVGRGPERAFVRSRHPCAGDPVVVSVVVGIGPVAGRPHEVRLGARRLLIDWQDGRCEVNTDTHTDLRMYFGCGDGCEQNKQEQRENAKDSHKVNLLSWPLRSTVETLMRFNPGLLEGSAIQGRCTGGESARSG